MKRIIFRELSSKYRLRCANILTLKDTGGSFLTTQAYVCDVIIWLDHVFTINKEDAKPLIKEWLRNQHINACFDTFWNQTRDREIVELDRISFEGHFGLPTTGIEPMYIPNTVKIIDYQSLIRPEHTDDSSMTMSYAIEASLKTMKQLMGIPKHLLGE